MNIPITSPSNAIFKRRIAALFSFTALDSAPVSVESVRDGSASA
jgi:hypothetical protein